MKKKTKKSDGISGGVVVEALDDDEKRAKREQLENASANADEAEEVSVGGELQCLKSKRTSNRSSNQQKREYLTEEVSRI